MGKLTFSMAIFHVAMAMSVETRPGIREPRQLAPIVCKTSFGWPKKATENLATELGEGFPEVFPVEHVGKLR